MLTDVVLSEGFIQFLNIIEIERSVYHLVSIYDFIFRIFPNTNPLDAVIVRPSVKRSGEGYSRDG